MPGDRYLSSLKNDGHLRVFEQAYREYHHQFQREKDPIAFAHRFENPPDREVAAFLAALLAYGNVAAIFGGLEKVFGFLGPHPAQKLRDGVAPHLLSRFRYRFTTGADLASVFAWLGKQLRTFGSLEQAFLSHPGSHRERMQHWVESFEAMGQKDPKRLTQLRHLFPNPARGSACKRYNLFLRWVCRPEDGIDLGLWTQVSPRELFLPLDTHLLRVLIDLDWLQRPHASWKAVELVTQKLTEICPEDPIRYDFSLCHFSMAGKRILV